MTDVHLCQIDGCESASQVLIDVKLVQMGYDGVLSMGTRVICVCRIHAVREAGRA